MKRALQFLLASAVLSSLMGCPADSVGDTNYQPPTAAQVDQEIKAIENDPNLPPQAKAIKIGMLKQNGTGQTKMGSPASK